MNNLSANKSKTSNAWRWTLGLALATMLCSYNAIATGNDILIFTSQTEMINTGVESNEFGGVGASGELKMMLDRDGNTNTQSLDIKLAKLKPNTTYLWSVFIGEGTNQTAIAEFTTDAKGAFEIKYVIKGSELMAPPYDVLNPMCDIREIDIVNGDEQTVLRAVLADPDSGHYLVNRTMNNTGFLPAAAGTLLIRADQNATQFRLQASGLTPNTNYVLVINGSAVQTNSANKLGKLTLTSLPTNSPDVLDIQMVELTDFTGTNVILINGGLGLPCTMIVPSLATVIYTIPTNTATGVALNDNIAATFSEIMDSSTIDKTSFTLEQGTKLVSGTLTYSGVTAVFNPINKLKPNTLYTVTITTDVQDLFGNPLATNFVWSFTTGTQIDANANTPTIDLGAASTFAILATAAISGAGDEINGDVGLQPGSSQGIDPSEINGTIYVNDQTVVNAQNSLLAAYNQVVAESTKPQSLPGNLGGLTLTPGLYVNGSSTGISGTGANAILTLNGQGNANAVFIFKMASTLITGPGTSIVLSGNAQAKNVFWQVGSSATLGTTTIFKGNILASVSIIVNNGSAVDGRLFAGASGDLSGAVTVQTSTVTLP